MGRDFDCDTRGPLESRGPVLPVVVNNGGSPGYHGGVSLTN